jgi:hypothetical protein
MLRTQCLKRQPPLARTMFETGIFLLSAIQPITEHEIAICPRPQIWASFWVFGFLGSCDQWSSARYEVLARTPYRVCSCREANMYEFDEIGDFHDELPVSAGQCTFSLHVWYSATVR